MRNSVYLNKIKIVMLTGLFVLIFSAASWATEYYVDIAKGNDGNSGTQSSPWRTIGKANNVLKAGDTVYIKAGTYNQGIAPANSGTAANRIIYHNHNDEQVIISGVSTGINLTGRSYITVSGIDVKGTVAFARLENNSHHNKVENGVFSDLNNNANNWPTGIYIQRNARYNVISNVIAGNCGRSQNGSDLGGVVQLGADIGNDTTNYNLIENCTLYNGGHHVLGVYSGYNILRNNHFFNEDWMNGGTFGNRCIAGNANTGYGDFLVIEGNRFSYSSSPPDAPFSDNIKYSLDRSIIRNNVIYDANGNGIQVNAFKSGASSNHHRIYNNVIYHNGYRSSNSKVRHGIAFVSYASAPLCQGTVVVNNIFQDNYGGSISYVINGRDSAANHDIRTNWWDTDRDPLFKNSTIPASPSDTEIPDLMLQPNSPCIDAGEFLTTITSASGSGKTFQVEDATFFIDGMGIVEGDTIQFQGQMQTATIVDIDYPRNQITVDKTITWNRGSGVSLPYNGSAPDLGVETTSVKSVEELLPPDNLRILNP